MTKALLLLTHALTDRASLCYCGRLLCCSSLMPQFKRRYGTASEEVFGFQYAVLVGAGIGATPAASILKHIQYRLRNRTGCQTPDCRCKCNCCYFRLRRLYFVWSNRELEAFKWFADYLAEIQAEELAREAEAKARGDVYEKLIDIRVFLTAVSQTKDDLATIFLHVGVNEAQQAQQQDILTSLHSATTFGRPNFDVIFSELSVRHPAQSIGVFFCGPAALGKSLRDDCVKHTARNVAKFEYKQEIF
eukprot:m.787580 g.787580  ORF g.787580 m.787580 type:complete len:247 (+) comp59188_c0_seq42:3880-4620(+)